MEHGIIRNVAVVSKTSIPFPYDIKEVVGSNMPIKSIRELLNDYNAIYNGMLVQDVDHGVVYQIYMKNNQYQYRLHHGTFYVDLIDTFIPDDPRSRGVFGQIDGVQVAQGQIVLCLGCFDPKNNGVWVVKSGGWYRHPVFDDNTDMVAGIIFRASLGFRYKNSLWMLSNYGDVVIGTTNIYFHQVLPATEYNINSVTSPVKYSFFNSLSNELITLGINLVPGVEYKIVKTSYDGTTILRQPGTLEYVGTLAKRGDWVSIIKTLGTQLVNQERIYINRSDSRVFVGIGSISTAPPSIAYLSKENVYVIYGGLPSGDVEIYYPVDCYNDFVYYIEVNSAFAGTTNVYSYDLNVLGNATGGNSVTLYHRPGDFVYSTRKVIINSNSYMFVRIPPQWKLGNINIEHLNNGNTATGWVEVNSTFPVAGDKIILTRPNSVIREEYTFVNERQAKYDIPLAFTRTGIASNIVSAINRDSSLVTATLSSFRANLTAKHPYLGTSGNSITIDVTGNGLTKSGNTLTGGTDNWPSGITINIGTTAGGSDVVSNFAVQQGSVNVIPINRVLSPVNATQLYISSPAWGSSRLLVNATRYE